MKYLYIIYDKEYEKNTKTRRHRDTKSLFIFSLCLHVFASLCLKLLSHEKY